MASLKKTKILVVGPMPPPIAGTSVSFQIFCQEARRFSDKLAIEVINSAPKQLGQKSLFTAAHFSTAVRLLRRFGKSVRQVDHVLIFGSNQFLASVGILCINIARMAGKPCHIRAFGGSLEQYYDSLNPFWRSLFRNALHKVDGLIVQTKLLDTYFRRIIGDKVHLVPGYRAMPGNGYPNSKPGAGEKLRLVFLGHIREEKGAFTLLESLRALSKNDHEPVFCDFFGPIYPAIAARFKRELATTKNATYRGVLSRAQVLPRLSKYDVLVFPTYYQGEGHPGVLIEAMMAGIPVITTAFRSISEVVKDRVNGLLVTPKDPRHLLAAIQLLARDRQLLTKMATKNWEKRARYDSTTVAPLILRAMNIDIESDQAPQIVCDNSAII